LFSAIEREPNIEFIAMPPQLVEKYQYFTEARMDRLISAGYAKGFSELEAGVGDYVRTFLGTANPYR
jgi:ADP-L-glycero-D-manno-heptose 6-epimerase